jgi:preprotein translocase subunit SecE
MAKSISDKTASNKAPARTNGGGLKNPFARSSGGPKSQSQGPRGAVANKPAGRIRTFLREVRIEMSKVTWPPRKEILTSTGVVIAAVIIASVYIGVWDFIWNTIVRYIGPGY